MSLVLYTIEIYMSPLIRFAEASSQLSDFINRNKILTAKFLKQGYRYHKLRQIFSKCRRSHSELISKSNVDENTYAGRSVRTLISWQISLYIQKDYWQN